MKRQSNKSSRMPTGCQLGGSRGGRLGDEDEDDQEISIGNQRRATSTQRVKEVNLNGLPNINQKSMQHAQNMSNQEGNEPQPFFSKRVRNSSHNFK